MNELPEDDSRDLADDERSSALAKVSANIKALEAMMRAGLISPTIGTAQAERSEPNCLKEIYLNNYGNSGVVGYEKGEDSITVEFEDGSIYLYNDESAGSEAIRMMKQLAVRGDGLNTYINLHVKERFASRLDERSSHVPQRRFTPDPSGVSRSQKDREQTHREGDNVLAPFVVTENNLGHELPKNAPEVITIHASFSLTPYAWKRSSSDSSLSVGRGIACPDDGLSKSLGISSKLDRELADWINQVDWRNKTVPDWDRFHAEGLSLARRLKALLGERYEVEYAPPGEDPIRQGIPIMRIVTPDEGVTYNPFPPSETIPGRDSLVDTLIMELRDCKYGWICMNLVCGHRRLRFEMSHVFDPVPCFMKWMEQLVSDQEVCEFKTNEEGPEKQFLGINLSNGLIEFVVKDLNNKPTEFWRSTLRRRQLIETIYRGFQQYGKSPDYDPREWEIQTLGEWLEERTGRKQSEILDFLTALDNGTVALFCHAIAPSHYCYNINDDLMVMSSLEEILSYAITPDQEIVRKSQADSPTDWINDQAAPDRRGALAEFMNTQVSSNCGTSLRILCSETLDAYLSSDRDRDF